VTKFQAKCFDTSTVKFKGVSYSDNGFLHFSVVKCTGSKICQSQKQIDNELKRLSLAFIVTNNYIDFDSFEKPIKTEITSKAFQLGTRKTYRTSFSISVVSLKDSIM